MTLERPTEQKRHKALHGLYRSLINNMVEGVNSGYKKDMELVGVGYKACCSEQRFGAESGIFPQYLFCCS